MDSASCSARTAASDSPEGEHGGRADRPRALDPPRRETPDRPFLRCEGRSWTFAELDADVRELAGGLSELGVGRETRVLAGLSNRAETVIAPAGPAAAGRRPRAPARRAFLRGARLPDRALRGRAPDRRRAGGRHAAASPRRVPGCQAGRAGGRPVPRQRAPLRRPAAPRSAARRTARRLRRPVADGHPLHVRQHRPAQGRRCCRAARSSAAARRSPSATASSRTTTSSCPCRSPTRPAR